jgi:hypothetical protein
LDGNRKHVLDILPKISKQAVLGGGTSIALQLGHRKSYDFDMFLENELDTRELIRNIRKEITIKEIITRTIDEVTVITDNDVKLTFLYYPFPLLYNPIKYNQILLFDLRDSAISKAHTIGRRGEYKDYVDLFFLMQYKVTIESIITGAQKSFGVEFNEKLFLEQLVYFEDITDFTIDFVDKVYSKEEIKRFFEKEVRLFIKL